MLHYSNGEKNSSHENDIQVNIRRQDCRTLLSQFRTLALELWTMVVEAKLVR